MKENPLFVQNVAFSSKMKHFGLTLHMGLREGLQNFFPACGMCIMAQEVFEAGKAGDIALLKQMKKIRGNKKQQQSCPDNIDNVSGPEEISELFKSVYEKSI